MFVIYKVKDLFSCGKPALDWLINRGNFFVQLCELYFDTVIKKFTLFFKKFLEDMSPFCGGH